VSWHYSIEALAVAPALSTRKRVLSLSLLQVRTLPSRVMTSESNRARHERIQLPTIIKVRPRRLLGTWTPTIGDRPGPGLPPGRGTVRGRSPIWPGTARGTLPRPRPGDGDAPPSPSPICPESGTLPRPRPRFGGDGDAPPSPIPIHQSIGGPRPGAFN
jgi:hypothetical protein